MSRTKHCPKSNTEFWGKRPHNRGGGPMWRRGVSRYHKTRTHRTERRQAKKDAVP